ncbi:MAG: hypothetical protein C0407_19385, partial [Desulfobacca sp.]|nr:hypothetical protein [Desulfobacca sp.]
RAMVFNGLKELPSPFSKKNVIILFQPDLEVDLHGHFSPPLDVPRAAILYSFFWAQRSKWVIIRSSWTGPPSFNGNLNKSWLSAFPSTGNLDKKEAWTSRLYY